VSFLFAGGEEKWEGEEDERDRVRIRVVGPWG
jgi:hypothetical protein